MSPNTSVRRLCSPNQSTNCLIRTTIAPGRVGARGHGWRLPLNMASPCNLRGGCSETYCGRFDSLSRHGRQVNGSEKPGGREVWADRNRPRGQCVFRYAERRNSMTNWTDSIALAVMAATLTLAACTEDDPASMTEAGPEIFDTETVLDGWMVPASGSTFVATHIDACHTLWSLRWRRDEPMSEQEARDTVLAACSRDRSDEELERELERLVPRLTAEPLESAFAGSGSPSMKRSHQELRGRFGAIPHR